MHKRFIHSLILIFSIIGLVLTLKISAEADNPSAWINSLLFSQKESDTVSVPTSLNGNIDCSVEDSTNCSVPTIYGSATQNGTVRLNGTSDFKPVISYVDNRQHFLPIPNSNSAITYTTEPPYGFYLYFNYNFSSSITKTTIPGTTATQYQVNRAQDGKLTDKTNHRLAADYASMSFSANGQWMVVSEPNVAMLRVNLQTFEVVPFAPGFNYTIGIDPALKTAITNDGRYAVVASKDFARFAIYDLSTCASVPDIISGPVSCQARDLQSFMQQQVAGYSFVSNARFLDNNLIAAYVTYKGGSTNKTARYIISNSSISNQIDYLALGDSYISGEGAFDYQGGTDTPDNSCHLSLVSYPYLFGRELNYNSYHSIACSGAITSDITDSTIGYKGQAQHRTVKRSERSAEEIDSIFTSFKPGYVNQSDFVQKYRPKAITVSIGGNDVGMINRLKNCLKPGTCYADYEDRLEFVREVNSKFPTLVNTYNKIKGSGSPGMSIYVIGYPQIAIPNGNCAVNVHLNNDEIIFVTKAISYLNSVIKNAAAKAGAYYVDAEDAFFGHRLCEAGPGSVAMNGLTAGNDIPSRLGGPIGNETYHPNAFGQQLLENKVLAATHNLADPMPTANLSSAPPSESGLDILNAPHSGRATKVAEYDQGISDDLIFKQTAGSISVDGASHALKPSTTLQAVLYSDPTVLGNFTTDINGNLSAQIQISANTETGYHTLHFYGTDINGQAIDIYKNIYIAASIDDFDGDGIPDGPGMCIGIPLSGQDYDQDGTDDACDGTIDVAPPPPPPVPEPAPAPKPLPEPTPDPSEILSADPPPTPMDINENLAAQIIPTAEAAPIQSVSPPEALHTNALALSPSFQTSPQVPLNNDISQQSPQVLASNTTAVHPVNLSVKPNTNIASSSHKSSKPAILVIAFMLINIFVGITWKVT